MEISIHDRKNAYSLGAVLGDIRKKLPKNDNNMVKYGLKTLDAACCLPGYPYDIFSDHCKWTFFAHFLHKLYRKSSDINLKEQLMAPRTFWLSVMLTLLIGIATGCMDRLPYDFNGKVTRYPNSKIVNLMKLQGGCYAELETNDPWEKVLEYYKDQMGRSGWTIRVERQLEPWRMKNPDATAFLALFKGSEGLMIDARTPPHSRKTKVALFLGGMDE